MHPVDDGLEQVERDSAEAALLRIVLIANALNETRKSGVMAAVSGPELTAICRPLVAKLRDLCGDVLGPIEPN